jgi:hypothetical protein
MVAAAGGAALPASLQDQIANRSDGVPLFAEELTRTALEHGTLAVPVSLQDALMARLDRHPAAKRAAQLGAAIGRCFSHELVAAIAEEPAAEFDHGLEVLVASGLADCHGPMPATVYTFKHALVRDAAYEIVLRNDRSAIHRRIVDALIGQEPGIKQSQPGLLAHHCEQAGALEQSAEYYLDAGWQNNYRAAYTESRAQFGNALRVAGVLPEGQARDHAEMRALRGFGLTMANAVGYGSSEFARLPPERPRCASGSNIHRNSAGSGSAGLFSSHSGRTCLARLRPPSAWYGGVNRAATFAVSFSAASPLAAHERHKARLSLHDRTWNRRWSFTRGSSTIRPSSGPIA